MSIQVGSGLTPPDRPETVPDAVELVWHQLDGRMTRESVLYFAEDLFKENRLLYEAVVKAQFQETGHDFILNVREAAEALVRWADFAESIGQFKPKPFNPIDHLVPFTPKNPT